MKPEDIKVGDCYPVLAHVGYKNKKGNYDISINWGDGLMEGRTLTPADACAMFSIYETKPKYDPCRLLRKGDRVQVKKRNGRCNGKHGEYLREAFCEVAEDEVPNELVRVYHNSSEYLLDPAYLELVTPVEELEPYTVVESYRRTDVMKGDYTIATYTDSHPHAKEAAEAERARLNAEYRKEQNNG